MPERPRVGRATGLPAALSGALLAAPVRGVG